MSDSEIIDFYSESGVRLGCASREEVHSRGLWHQTVYVWVLDSDNNLLLQLRSPQKKACPGHWDISCAGHILSGSSPLEAAKREFSEELGLDLSGERFRFLFTWRNVYRTPGRDNLDCEQSWNFLVRLNEQECSRLRPEEGEVVCLDWLSVSLLLSQAENSWKGKPLVPHAELYKQFLLSSGFS